MSFIIQGTDLPKDGKALHMRVQSDGVVRYLIEGDDPVHIIDGARAIQIPKDHGRIIDETEVRDNVRTITRGWPEYSTGDDYYEAMQKAHAILEAENEE